MNRKTLITLIVALIVVASAIYIVYRDMHKTSAPVILSQVPTSPATFESIKDSMTSPSEYYTIVNDYPKITSNMSNPSDTYFNNAVTKTEHNIIASFKKGLLPPEKLQKISDVETPINANSNQLTTSFEVITNTPKIISIRFSNKYYYYQAERPGVFYKTLNFDRTTGRILALSDLFIDNTSYLTIIVKYSREQLAKLNPTDINIITTITANLKNYSNWNVSSDGIMISFPPYFQHEEKTGDLTSKPYEVVIPYALLKNYIAPTSVADGLIK